MWRQLTEEECVKALQSFQDNIAPGNDGLPIEFYSKFWEIISEPFVNCVNKIFTGGEMSRSQKQAVITLIEKKGNERSLLENWRPISLVNVDPGQDYLESLSYQDKKRPTKHNSS